MSKQSLPIRSILELAASGKHTTGSLVGALKKQEYSESTIKIQMSRLEKCGLFNVQEGEKITLKAGASIPEGKARNGKKEDKPKPSPVRAVPKPSQAKKAAKEKAKKVAPATVHAAEEPGHPETEAAGA